MSYNLIGKDFIPPDVMGKVTGKAKYSEDFRAEGMLFCRLLLSPMPHARVRSIDTSEALKVPGVVAVLTADDIPAPPPPTRPVLTNEPHYVGQPILALAAENETAAQDALGVYQDLRLVRHEHRPLLRRALGLETFSTYDAIYVALAERLGAPLLTTDGRLARAVVTTRGVNVSLA